MISSFLTSLRYLGPSREFDTNDRVAYCVKAVKTLFFSVRYIYQSWCHVHILHQIEKVLRDFIPIRISIRLHDIFSKFKKFLKTEQYFQWFQIAVDCGFFLRSPQNTDCLRQSTIDWQIREKINLVLKILITTLKLNDFRGFSTTPREKSGTCNTKRKLLVMYQSNRSFNIPPRAYPGHLTSFPAREEGIWLT